MLKNILLVLLFPLSLFAQGDSIFEKEISAGDYTISLTNNENDFFTGNIQITDKNKNSVFTADSIYTRYNWDTLIDLNNDGSKELILDLGTGATMYDYNMFLIFDFSKTPAAPLEVHNAELKSNVDEIPKILSHVRLGPSALGAGYSYSLKYENGKLVLEKDMNESKVLKSLDIDNEEDLNLIKEYAKEFDECAKNSDVKIYYEAYVTQQKILGREEKGWEFFDNNYKCKNKSKVKTELLKTVQDNYDFWNSSEFKFGGEGNY